MTRVLDMKPGQTFRILQKRYELLKPCGPGSAYVKILGTEKEVKIFSGTSDEGSFTSPAHRTTIAPTAEIDEVLS